jgi:hypothetical protein
MRLRFSLPWGMESCPPDVRSCVMAGRSTTKNRPTTGSESWGARVNGSFPRDAVQPQRKPLPPREEWHVRAKRWAQAGQSRPSLALWVTLVPVPAERVVPRFRYQYLHLVLPHQEKEKRVELFPPDSLQWTPPLALALCQPLPVRRLSFVALVTMRSCVASCAERDQVLL